MNKKDKMNSEELYQKVTDDLRYTACFYELKGDDERIREFMSAIERAKELGLSDAEINCSIYKGIREAVEIMTNKINSLKNEISQMRLIIELLNLKIDKKKDKRGGDP